MKITLTAEQAANFKNTRELANKGCKVCPCCHTGSHTSYVYWTRIGLFHAYRADCYNCEKCGAEWQSDWYRV